MSKNINQISVGQTFTADDLQVELVVVSVDKSGGGEVDAYIKIPLGFEPVLLVRDFHGHLAQYTLRDKDGNLVNVQVIICLPKEIYNFAISKIWTRNL